MPSPNPLRVGHFVQTPDQPLHSAHIFCARKYPPHEGDGLKKNGPKPNLLGNPPSGPPRRHIQHPRAAHRGTQETGTYPSLPQGRPRTERLTSQTATEVDWIPVFQFLMFSVVSTPPNFLWQDFLESSFPARGRRRGEERLSVRNTLLKLALDQTAGAAFNTLLFSVYMHSIHSAMPEAPRVTSFTKAAGYWMSPGAIDFSSVDVAAVWWAALAEFWTIVLAGLKLWPAVSLVNFTLVKTVEGRNLVGCVAGLGWGVYMSMIAAKQ
ncbi:Mpv17/PMP22 [Metarhizium album ARSEF 1941]|uniref:Mpv17/PMP22 n=1 Tax=Metarhizium album (strain ARSEF 1941) TaxID=1081103 RepID=A0A0B2WMP5_METAS|nr:Mpv17/PMP22 [Metarhizium album ARSEF 1941]KHN94265.1 Mpv17/PMP22 [Metarhizium album ARSEF 1941]